MEHVRLNRANTVENILKKTDESALLVLSGSGDRLNTTRWGFTAPVMFQRAEEQNVELNRMLQETREEKGEMEESILQLHIHIDTVAQLKQKLEDSQVKGGLREMS